MKLKLTLFTLFSIGTISMLIAQQTISIPINFRIQGDSMIIEYDLSSAKEFKSLDVNVLVALNGNPVNVKNLSGDLKKVSPEPDRKIIWNLAADSIEVIDGILTVTLQVYPDQSKQLSLFKDPKVVKISSGALLIVGTGSIVLGLTKEAQASKIYAIYEENKKEWYPIYENKSREEHYQEANEQHIKAQWLTYSGSALAIVGGTILVLKLKRSGKTKQSGFNPLFEENRVGLQYKF